MTLQHTTEEFLNNKDTQYYPTSNRNVKDRLQHFPAPQYIIFYNGLTEEPDASILKLSDAFLENTC